MGSTDTVIELSHVGKAFRLGEHVGGRRSARDVLRRVDRDDAQFWALRDIDLEVSEGEVLGIVGGNGSGKSTLLKLINRVMAPTTGSCRTRGTVGSLLEVGAGFHAELTGRENIYLVGSLLGMKKASVESRFDRIVEFAGVQAHIDTPVKRYSSGMYLRLGFAVSAHLDADIMLVDEVLAVGDQEFQRQCVDKLRSLALDGRTVVFISHNLGTVGDLCQRAIWLDRGNIRSAGAVADVLIDYRAKPSDSHQNGGQLVLGLPEITMQPSGPSIVTEASIDPALVGCTLQTVLVNANGVSVLESDAGSTVLQSPHAVLRLPLPMGLLGGQYEVTVSAVDPATGNLRAQGSALFHLPGQTPGVSAAVARLPNALDIEAISGG